MRRHKATTALFAAILSGSLLLAGCGGDDKGSDSKGNDGTEDVKHDPAEPKTWPLTGLPLKKGESAELEHPVLVTKVDNTSGSQPQIGLGQADLVVEEAVEGRVTRLAVFYYSDLPTLVGPVRSMRASDIGIVAPVGGTMVTSGAAQITIDRLDKAGVKFVQEGAAGFSRATDRSAPYNLMADLGKVSTSDAKAKAARPDDYLPWGDAADLPKGQPATSISATFGPAHTTQWSFDNGTYVNTNTFAADGDEFPATSVLALTVEVGDAGYTDPAGNPVPETKFVGKGDAILFHDGKAVRGTWSKETLESELTLETKAGDLIVPPGKVWVELVPQDTGDVSFE